MKAALVTAYGHNPQYADAPEPVASEEEIVIDVLAAALAPRVRSQAAGSHYTSTGALPLIPGVDGVGALPDGRQVYFLLPPDTTHGSMAQRVAMDPRRSVVLPEGADPVVVAATMNPAMASWVALRQRAHWRPGGSVLVLGATGSAGRAAVRVAHHLGAAEIVAVGRNATRMSDLTEFGVRRCIELDDDRSPTKSSPGLSSRRLAPSLCVTSPKPGRTPRHPLVWFSCRETPQRGCAWLQRPLLGGIPGC
ncbi:quinone oxidoreductase family protein [Propioniciclava flava]|uniref:Quinone oxidoreductase n=1 Tax=Propioniciclava flava TaxID=2072026 RepID=A0A4Q2EIU7_9ACTN|nr:zinc-binding alcohol dehydrogenase family protein [Propioniciclava flava]RXW33063.1 quinone oxidoreductase [Propioniciclava flava]